MLPLRVGSVAIVAGAVVMTIPVILTLFLNKLPQVFENIKSSLAASRSQINKNIENVAYRLEQNLTPIKGNEEAKKRIIEITLGWIESKQSTSRKSKTGGLVLYITGPSGIGKTMAANAVTKALLGEQSEPVIISLSSIDQASKDSTDIQLFGKKTEAAYGNLKIIKDTPLVNQLKRNPKTVVIFNEYDKLQKRDGTLDARLWDIADNGSIEVDGEKLDCSEAIFIVTSNEKPSCIGAKDNDQPDQMATEVEHSFAFKSRVNVIVFENPETDVYADALKSVLMGVSEDYKERYNMDLYIEDGDVNLIASEIHKVNRGIRGVNQFVHKLYSSLIEYRMSKKMYGKSRELVKVIVGYSSDSEKFIVEEMDDKKLL